MPWILNDRLMTVRWLSHSGSRGRIIKQYHKESYTSSGSPLPGYGAIVIYWRQTGTAATS